MKYYVVTGTREVNPKKLIDKPKERVFVDNFFFKSTMKVKDIGVCEFCNDILNAGVFTEKMAHRVLDKIQERFKDSIELDCHFYKDFHIEEVAEYRKEAFNTKIAIRILEVK